MGDLIPGAFVAIKFKAAKLKYFLRRLMQWPEYVLAGRPFLDLTFFVNCSPDGSTNLSTRSLEPVHSRYFLAKMSVGDRPEAVCDSNRQVSQSKSIVGIIEGIRIQF